MKVVLVTGGGKGIGCAIATLFHKLDYKVYIFYPVARDIDESLPEEVRERAIQADFACSSSIRVAFDKLREIESNIHILVNNSGVYPRCDFREISLEDWNNVININLTSVFLCSQEVLSMMPRTEITFIVNISSDAAILGPLMGAHYAATKAGIIGLTKSMSNALASEGVNVNVILPGVTDTDQSNLTPEKKIKKNLEIPLGRVATPVDIAKVAVSLTSGGMDYVTGQSIIVDGGKNSI